MWCRIAKVVAAWVVVCLAGLPGQVAAQCEDINNSGLGDRDDIELLADYLKGKDVYLAPESQFLDCNEGWTVADLYYLTDAIFWWCRQWACCGDWPHEYSFSTVSDTIFFPSAVDIPDSVSNLELPIYMITDLGVHGWYCPGSVMIPVNSKSAESNDCFALDTSHYRWEADTAILVVPQHWATRDGDPPRVLMSMKYERINPGLGQVIPEVLDSVVDRRLSYVAMDTRDRDEWNPKEDVFVPTVVTYEASICCWVDVGNVDCDTSQNVDIGDVTELIKILFITLADPCCLDAANIDSDRELTVDVGDLTLLIKHLFISPMELEVECNMPRLPR